MDSNQNKENSNPIVNYVGCYVGSYQQIPIPADNRWVTLLNCHCFSLYLDVCLIDTGTQEFLIRILPMVLILDGSTEKGAHLWTTPGYLISLIYLCSLTAVTSLIFFSRKYFFSFIRAQHVLSYHLIEVP